MKYFFRSSEIYVKLPHSSRYPTRRDTPIVPIRGLWVSGIHRSIFNIDHGIQISNIESTSGIYDDAGTVSVDFHESDGCSVLGHVVCNTKPTIQVYSTTSTTVNEKDGCTVMGHVICNETPNTLKYSQATSNFHESDGCTVMGHVMVSFGNHLKHNSITQTDYEGKGDAQGLFVSTLIISQATITDVNE